MKNFSPNKPRAPGTQWAAISEALDQLGGVERAAEALQRKRWWAYTISDEDASERAQTRLSYADACTMAEKGGTALVDHMAHRAGGVFIPAAAIDEACLKAAMAEFSAEAGDLIGNLILATSDGEVCRKEALTALTKVQDALAPLLALYAACEAKAQSNVVTMKGAA